MPEEKAKLVRNCKFYNEFPCSRIRARIEALGWTLGYAAEKMREFGIENVTAEAVRQWHGGYSRPDMSKLKDIAAVLKCSVNYLFGVDDLPDMTEDQIYKMIGLRGKCIEVLKGFVADGATGTLNTINTLIENDDKYEIIENIKWYMHVDYDCSIDFVLTGKTTGRKISLDYVDGGELLDMKLFEDIKDSLKIMRRVFWNNHLPANSTNATDFLGQSEEAEQDGET